MKTTTLLFPVDTVSSYVDYLVYMDNHFYGVLYRTTLDGDNVFAYDKNGKLIAFYDGENNEMWAVSTVSAVA